MEIKAAVCADKKPRGSGMMWKGMLWVFSATFFCKDQSEF